MPPGGHAGGEAVCAGAGGGGGVREALRLLEFAVNLKLR